jgi:hypothetical protein
MRANSAEMTHSPRLLAPLELSTVQFGTTALSYRLRRTQRRKTVSISVDPDAGIVVTAPAQATKKTN